MAPRVGGGSARREFAYAEKNRESLNAAEKHGFHVVRMKDDWKKVFTFEK